MSDAVIDHGDLIARLTLYEHREGYDGKDWEKIASEAAEAIRALHADKAMLTGQLQASRAMLAASTPVGGWEDISTAPDQGEILVGVWVDGSWSSWTICKEPNATTPFGCDGEWGDEPTHWMPIPPPPSVSIDTGDHIGETNEMIEGAAAWDREICTGCTSSLSIADIKARGIVSCCPDRNMVRIGDFVSSYQGSRPQEAVPTEQAEPAVVAALQDLLVAVTYAAPARTFAGVLAYEARVPVEFVERADAALSVSRPQPADGCSSNEGAGE